MMNNSILMLHTQHKDALEKEVQPIFCTLWYRAATLLSVVRET
jgi:hypothetical protein